MKRSDYTSGEFKRPQDRWLDLSDAFIKTNGVKKTMLVRDQLEDMYVEMCFLTKSKAEPITVRCPVDSDIDWLRQNIANMLSGKGYDWR